MVRFEELQDLWQNQQDRPAVHLDPRGLTDDLRRFGRRQTYINLAKVALIIADFTFLWVRQRHSLLAIAGGLVMLAGLVFYLFLDWRNQIGISRMNFSEPSVAFVHQALARLHQQRDPFEKCFWPLIISVSGGLNLLLWGTAGGAPLERQIVRHLTATALPFAAYAIGLKIRAKRYELECRPIETKLRTMLSALQERAL